MPEGLEAELYRRAALACIGRTVTDVVIDDRQAMAIEIGSELPGRRVIAIRRIGKLVLVDLSAGGSADDGWSDDGPAGEHWGRSITLGLHFGMTGRLIVDDAAPIDRLEYASGRDDPAWDRLVINFAVTDVADGGALRVNDPRRWARFTLDPDEARLGPDFLDVDRGAFGALLDRRAGLKAVLLDQQAVAGFGNLCVDEILWQTGLAPTRRCADLSVDEVDRLHTAIGVHLPAMLVRGGSHRGTISPDVREALPPCARDGTPLRRARVAGRTTVWCDEHQR